MTPRQTATAAAVAILAAAVPAAAQSTDPRLREIAYDAHAVVTVPVKRGVVTHVVLDPDEAITDIGSGLGGDCAKPEAAWCIAAQSGGRNIFVKPKSAAQAPNNLAVVTDRRTHAFRFVVQADGDPAPSVFRLIVKAPRPQVVVAGPIRETPPPRLAPPMPLSPPAPPPEEVVAERLKAKPQMLNSNYTLAEGDVVTFRGDQRHGYHNPGPVLAVAYSVIAFAPVTS